MEAIVTRFKEPSSWAAISALLLLFGVNVDSTLWTNIVNVGAGIAGIAGIAMREKRD